jgi:dipeptidyl aminopeptidase/acylaminoacyl peptidase
MKFRRLLLSVALCVVSLPAFARPMTGTDLVALRRLGAMAVSPDNGWLAWRQSEANLVTNKLEHSLWLLGLRRADAKPRRLVAADHMDARSPSFSVDGRWIYFIASNSGNDELWRLALAGGEPEQVTHYKVPLQGFVFSPEGDHVAIRGVASTSCDELPCRVPDAAEVCCGSARIYDQQVVRRRDEWAPAEARSQIYVPRWSAWMAPQIRSRIYVMPITGGPAKLVQGRLIGDALADDAGQVTWSADGKTLFFPFREAERSVGDIFAAAADGAGEPINMTRLDEGDALMPSISPDGKLLAHVVGRPRREAPCGGEISLRHVATGRNQVFLEGEGACITSLAWAQDGRSLLVTRSDGFDVPLLRLSLRDGKVTPLISEGRVGQVVPTARNGAFISLDSMLQPADFYRVLSRGQLVRMTEVNADRLAEIDGASMHRFAFAGAAGQPLKGWLIAPHRAAEKLPVVLSATPQNLRAAQNSWSYAWNPMLLSAPGYVVMGVIGDGNMGDSAEAELTDNLHLGLAAASKIRNVDATHVCSVNVGGRILGMDSERPSAFKCVIAHAGIFDTRALAYESDEFSDHLDEFDAHNPVNHVKSWRTPLLVLHGERDSRVPYTQSIAAFTAAQRGNVPSRLVMFPDEGAAIAKPKNVIQWYGEVFNWLGRWLPSG